MTGLRDRIAETLRRSLDEWITVEWICCDPPQRETRRMVAALLADAPEGQPPTSPVLDAVMAVVQAALDEQYQRAERVEEERDGWAFLLRKTNEELARINQAKEGQ